MTRQRLTRAAAAIAATGIAMTGIAVTAAGCSTTPAARPVVPVPTGVLRPDPLRYLPKVPTFTLTSSSISDGSPLPEAQWSPKSHKSGAEDQSPELSWNGAPATAKSYAITMYDPESPVEGGAMHWMVVNLPGTDHALAAGAGAPDGNGLPRGASEVVNSAGVDGYIGSNPVPGSGPHDYYVTVWALDTPHLSVKPSAGVAPVNVALFEHTIARATIVCPTSA